MNDRTKSVLRILISAVLIGAFVVSLCGFLTEFIPYINLKNNGIETSAFISGYESGRRGMSDVLYRYQYGFYDQNGNEIYVTCDYKLKKEPDVSKNVALYYDPNNTQNFCVDGVHWGEDSLPFVIVTFIAAVGFIACAIGPKGLRKKDDKEEKKAIINSTVK